MISIYCLWAGIFNEGISMMLIYS